nr:TIR-like protein FxsC [Micromonospora sp. DSM 115978]
MSPPDPRWPAARDPDDGDSFPSPSPPRLYFFLSYARSDDDPHVEQFYRDLCGEVRVRAGLPSTEEVGFFDRHSMGIGATWSAELVDALAEAGTFLALCSPRYFVSEACGKEWQIFADRIDRHFRSAGVRSRAIIPGFWLPPRRVPEVVQRLQYDSDVFGSAYRRDGLRQLLRLRRNQDEYLELLTVLAEQIVEHNAGDPLPPIPKEERFDFASAPSAFHPLNHQTAPPPGDPPPRSDHVHFMIAAPSRQEAGTVRRDTAFYGEDPIDWAPYLPSLPDSLASFARTVAAKRGLTSEVSALSSVDPETLGRRIVILLVDAWVTQIDAYRRILLDRETRDAPADTAMVPRNHEDSETDQNWRQLSDGLRSVFLRRVAAGEALAYRSDILSHRAFDEDLQVVLEVARNKMFAHSAGSADRPRPTPGRSRPILQGP